MEYSIHGIRERDIMNMYYAILKRAHHEGRYMTTSQIIDVLMKQGAPRFYIEFEKARRHISCMHRGVDEGFASPLRTEMYKEIYRRWLATGSSGYDTLEKILLEPAPSFYITAKRMKGLIYHAMRTRRKKR